MSEEHMAWYVLYTMPQHEKKIAIQLEKKKFEYYLPLISKVRYWSDRKKIIDFPLFPNYIFVNFDWAQRHVDILRIPGAVDFIRAETGRPSAIPDDDLANLRILAEKTAEVSVHPAEEFPPGREVVLRTGPLKGVRGIVQRLGSKNSIFVRVPLLNQMVSAQVDVHDLEGID